MTIKFLEVRDRGTFIACFAFRPGDFDSRLPWRAGFNPGNRCVIFGRLDEPRRTQYDPYAWENPFIRTLPEAHKWIEANYEIIQSGDVIDIEFILGETKTKKESELYE